ncbi:MAG: PAS domain S-box protein, partial [Desulfobulbaceae bacterium]|nr:PAS domain S-box protein [Desulfobulbaceae bacterium]
ENPYLDPDMVPELDITTPSGRVLTLMNPAYMVRQVYELSQRQGQIATRLTSLTPINPRNRADNWETAALNKFLAGARETSSIVASNGEESLRMMRPLLVEESCLHCHPGQDYKVGDIQGGLSITVPLSPFKAVAKKQLLMLLLTHLFFWIVGLAAIGLSFRSLHHRIRERKRVAEEIEQQKEHFRLLYDCAPVGYQALDEEGRLLDVNRAWLAMLGQAREEVVGRSFTEFLAPGLGDDFRRQYELFKKDGNTCDIKFRLRCKDGGERIVLLSGTIIRDEAGNFMHTQCTLQDITARTQVELALEKLRHQQEQILNSAGEGIYGVDRQGLTTFVNPAASRMLGWTQEELIGKPHHQVVHHSRSDSSPCPLEKCPIYAAIKDGKLHSGADETFWRRDGSSFPVEYTSTPIIENGAIKGAVVVFTDISARQQTEKALREQRNLFQTILAATNDLIALKDRNSIYLAVNPAFCKHLGRSEEEILGRSDHDLFPPEAAARYQHDDAQIMASGRPQALDLEASSTAQIGQWLHVAKTPVVDDKGQCNGILCSIHDITARKHAEEILENSEARFRGLFDNMNSGAAVFRAINDGRDFVFVDFNQAAEHIEKLDREEVIGKEIGEIFPAITDFGLIEVLRKVWLSGRSEHHPPAFYRDERISGWREHHVYKLPSGELVTLFDDVTQRKRVEDELRQAQKMEAIGTLAGGIAHDFNNILTAVIGYTQLMLYDVPADWKNRPLLQEVLTASKRATNLVNQILTFSRQTEKERKPIELQPVVKEAMKLLRGSLPATIEISQNINPACRPIVADPVQIHQILMNLCTNAYHAMREKGGVLTVSMQEIQMGSGFSAHHQELPPGPYIRLAVSDTGIGMDEQTLARIFDPYFTTKEPGEGTGLGLPTVLGLVKSYNGGITAESTLGKGSIFSVYLPIFIQDTPLAEGKEGDSPLPKLSAHILFIDDEETIVRLGKMTLERL